MDETKTRQTVGEWSKSGLGTVWVLSENGLGIVWELTVALESL
jgi:hypothetical protein